MAESAESKRGEIVPEYAGLEFEEVRKSPRTPAVGCEVPAIAHEHVLKMEVAEASSRDNNKRVEDARRALVAKLVELKRKSASEEEYNTARTQCMRTELDVTAFETMASTELISTSSSSCVPDSLSAEQLERIREVNRRHFQHLVKTESHPDTFRPSRKVPMLGYHTRRSPFFYDFNGSLEVGKKLGGGVQGGIHEAIFDGEVSTQYVLKVPGIGWYLEDLQRLWMKNISGLDFWKNSVGKFGICPVHYGTLLQDGRFVFVLKRYWGDLRKLIDIEIVKDETYNKPPFPHLVAVQVLWHIACGMRALHKLGILHRDLKAANILLRDQYALNGYCAVADFDSPKGVVGTGFWRAPEVLHALKDKRLHSSQEIWTKKVDVYSYGMTCYEVLTGCIPFEDRAMNNIDDIDDILEGERPPLPEYVDSKLQDLVRRCWHSQPEMRPDFAEIAIELFDMTIYSTRP